MKPPSRQALISTGLVLTGGLILLSRSRLFIQDHLPRGSSEYGLIAGVGLMFLGAVNLPLPAIKRDAPSLHENSPRKIASAIILLIAFPLAFSVARPSDPAAIVEAPPTRKSEPTSKEIIRANIERDHTKSESGYYQYPLPDLFFALNDPLLRSAIDGLKVRTVGRWSIDETAAATATRASISRLFITCCLADAKKIPIILEFGKTPPEYPPNGWVEISGTMTYPVENGSVQPVLIVDQARACDPPFEDIPKPRWPFRGGLGQR